MSYAAITEFMDAKERASFDLLLVAPIQGPRTGPAPAVRPAPMPNSDVQQLMTVMKTVPQTGRGGRR